MDSLKVFFNPPEIQNYAEYFQTLLSITGVLFGLAFTALIFIIQNGFTSFKLSRRMFLEVYVFLVKIYCTPLDIL